MSTDLNSEFTHFNLVIRLSKVQQSALRFVSHFQMSRCLPRSKEILSELHVLSCEATTEQSETSFSVPAASAFDTIHGMSK